MARKSDEVVVRTWAVRDYQKIWKESVVTRTLHKVFKVTAGWTCLDLKLYHPTRVVLCVHHQSNAGKTWVFRADANDAAPCDVARLLAQVATLQIAAGVWRLFWHRVRGPVQSGAGELPQGLENRRRSRTTHEDTRETSESSEKGHVHGQADEESPGSGTQGDQEMGMESRETGEASPSGEGGQRSAEGRGELNAGGGASAKPKTNSKKKQKPEGCAALKEATSCQILKQVHQLLRMRMEKSA